MHTRSLSRNNFKPADKMAAAATETPSVHLALATGNKILVTIETATPDILVVSFDYGAKCFQGALLDINKRCV